MDDWESAAVALQGVCVVLAGVSVLASAVGVPGIVDPFVVAGALFTLGFALGGAAAWSRRDRGSVALHACAVGGWVGVLGGEATRSVIATWGGLVLLAVAGLGLCYRAIQGYRRDESGISAS
jgi:hypothetical protein